MICYYSHEIQGILFFIINLVKGLKLKFCTLVGANNRLSAPSISNQDMFEFLNFSKFGVEGAVYLLKLILVEFPEKFPISVI